MRLFAVDISNVIQKRTIFDVTGMIDTLHGQLINIFQKCAIYSNNNMLSIKIITCRKHDFLNNFLWKKQIFSNKWSYYMLSTTKRVYWLISKYWKSFSNTVWYIFFSRLYFKTTYYTHPRVVDPASNTLQVELKHQQK